MRKLQVLDQSPDTRVRWTIARGMAMAATLLLLVALWIRPGPALLALWYIIIPVLPATFFVTPALWRGLCPLASLNEWGNRVRPAPEIPPATLGLLRATGLVLFLLVPSFSTAEFFLIVLMALLDFMAGFTVMTFTSRRTVEYHR